MSAIVPPDFERLGPPRGSRMVVVGGCGGIGRALVAAALRCCIQVAVFDLPESLAAHTLPEAVMAIQFEPAPPRSVDSAFAQIDSHWGGVDALVNLAGFTLPPRPVEVWSFEDWREVFDASYQSTLLRGAGGGRSCTPPRVSPSMCARATDPMPAPRPAWWRSPRRWRARTGRRSAPT